MKKDINTTITKRKYTAPFIGSIELDNAISLQLESEPSIGPNETINTPEYFNNNPLKSIYEA